jgi:hypothetical protein
MKRLLLLLLVTGLLISCKDKAKTGTGTTNHEKDDYLGSETKEKETREETKSTDFTSSGSSWTAADLLKLENQCAESFKDEPAAGKIMCPCLIEKFTKLYSSYAEMDSKTSYDEGKRLGLQCKEELGVNGNSNVSSGAGWPQSERDGFISSCVTNAMKQGRSRAVSQSYCDCMLDKMESLYPDINDASRLTDAQVDRIIAKYRDGCLEEH